MMHESQSSRQATPGGQSSSAGADSGAAATVTISGGGVRGAVVPGGYVFRGLPYAAPPPATCGGAHRARRPTGRVSATPPVSRRAARSRRTPP